MIEWVETHRPEMADILCYADAARPDLIEECRKAGWRIEKAKKDVFAGINTVKNMQLHITRDSKNIFKELSFYAWRRTRDGAYLDEPVKLYDDAMDAIRYAIFSAIDDGGIVKSFKMKGL